MTRRTPQPAPWRSCPASLRHRKPREFTLPSDVLAHLDALPPRTASAYVEACIRSQMGKEASEEKSTDATPPPETSA